MLARLDVVEASKVEVTVMRAQALDCFRIDPIDGYKDYGDLSAVEPPYRQRMQCDVCKTKWYGCWDNFQCPECGEGNLPESE